MLRLQRLARVPGAGDAADPGPAVPLLRRPGRGRSGGDQPIGVGARPSTVAGLPGAALRADRAGRAGDPRPTLVFFHGGGWIYGDLESHDAACRFLAERVRRPGARGRLPARARAPVPRGVRRRRRRRTAGWSSTPRSSAPTRPGWRSAATPPAATCPPRSALARRPGGAAAGLPAADLPGAPTSSAATESRRLFADGLLPDRRRSWTSPNESYFARRRPDAPTRGSSPLRADIPPGSRRRYVVTAGFDPLRDEGEAYAPQAARRPASPWSYAATTG